MRKSAATKVEQPEPCGDITLEMVRGMPFPEGEGMKQALATVGLEIASVRDGDSYWTQLGDGGPWYRVKAKGAR